MRQYLPLILCFVTFLSFPSFTQTIEFCDAFKDNNYTISYGFRRIMPTKDMFLNYIFIDQYYWKLNFSDNGGDKKYVNFVTTESQRSNWFGSDYSMALCLKTLDNENECTTYLLHKSHDYWAYGVLGSDENQLEMTGLKQNVSVSYNKTIFPLKSRTIGFVPNWGHKENGYTVVFTLKDGPNYTVHEIKENDPFGGQANHNNLKHDSLKSLPKSPEIVAMFGQYSEEHYNSYYKWHWFENLHGKGVIIVFKVGKTLKYCWTCVLELSETCKPKNQFLLIDCSVENNETIRRQPEWRPPRDTEEDEMNSNIIIAIIIALIAIFLITFIIVIVVTIKECNKNKEPFKGLKPAKPKNKFLESMKVTEEANISKEEVPNKSEIFDVKSNIDYSKPIPLESNITSDSQSSVRPTDLKFKQK